MGLWGKIYDPKPKPLSELSIERVTRVRFDPNGLNFKYAGILIFQLIGGMIFSVWAVEDEVGMMSQLGLELIPTKQ